MQKPQPLAPAIRKSLVENKIVSFSFESRRGFWCCEILLFSLSCAKVFQVLWQNFLEGNLPVHADLLRKAHSMTHPADIFKHHPAWKRIIVGNGKGFYWLRVPEEFLPAPSPHPVPDSVPQEPGLAA